MGQDEQAKRELLRHTVATLAYRGGKALRAAPQDFGGFRCAETTRTPVEILKAEILAGRVGPDQAPARVEFD